MTISFNEIPNSARVNSAGSLTLQYLLWSTSSSDELQNRVTAYGKAKDNLEDEIGGLFLSKFELTEVGPMMYVVQADYGVTESKLPKKNNFKWAFDSTGGTKHITHGLEHINSYVPSGKTPEDHKGAIGWREQGDVDGVDFPDRHFAWTETWQLELATYGFGYCSTLGELAGCVNSATFRGRPAYTVLFGGAVGGPMEADPALLEVTYHFEYQPNRTNIHIGDITVSEKLGWDVLSICYTAIDGTNSLTVNPKQVDVDRPAYYLDFSSLGIGTT